MSSGAGGGSGGGSGGQSTKPSAPPGGGATSLGSGRDYSAPSTSTGGGGDARESYGAGGQYQQTTTPSAPSVSVGGGDSGVDVGFQEALRQQAIRQADPVYGDPDPYIDVPIEERDTITSFLDNYAANVKANPFELGLIGALKTAYQTEQAKNMLLDTPGYEFLRDYSIANNTPTGGEGRDAITNIISQAPYLISGSTPQESMVNQYFANMGNMGQSLSSSLQTSYNNAKNSINNILGITPPSQQFGYSADPYGGLMASNLTTNPYNIDYLRRLGLI